MSDQVEPWDMRNMNLNEYQKAIKTDSNLWWRLASGTQLNLLDEAIDENERLKLLLREAVDMGPLPSMDWFKRAAKAAGGE